MKPTPNNPKEQSSINKIACSFTKAQSLVNVESKDLRNIVEDRIEALLKSEG